MKRSLAPSTLIAKKILCSEAKRAVGTAATANGGATTTRTLNSLVKLISSNKEKREGEVFKKTVTTKKNKKQKENNNNGGGSGGSAEKEEEEEEEESGYKVTPTSLSSLLRLASNKENITLDPETGKLVVVAAEDKSKSEEKEEGSDGGGGGGDDGEGEYYVEHRNKPIRKEGQFLYYWGKYPGKDGKAEVCIVEVGYEQCKVVGMDGKQGARLAITRGPVTNPNSNEDDNDNDNDEEDECASQEVTVKGGKKAIYLCYGQTVRFGTKAVTLYDEIPEDHYKSGAVFLAKPPPSVLRGELKKRADVEAAAGGIGGSSNSSSSNSSNGIGGRMLGRGTGRVMLAAARRPHGFVCPFKAGSAARQQQQQQQRQRRRTEPLWPVNGPNALVLYSPSVMARGKVAVVVDPRLSRVLRPHQREGVQFMYDCVMGLKGGFKGNGCILADGMGMGKTIQAITLLWTLLRQGPDGVPAARKALIVAPSSLVANWGKEIRKWLGGSSGGGGEEDSVGGVATVADSSKKSMSDLGDVTYGKAEILIISYDQLKIHIEEIAKLEDIGLVICDEGHKLKNANIQCARAVAAIKTRRRVILTGTPIQNDLEEFYAMVNFVNPGVLGDLALFKKVYERPIVNEDQDRDLELVSRARSEELSRITGQFILRRSNNLNRKYLPPKLEYVVFCALTPLQRSIYERIVGKGAASVEALQVISALRKLCNHPRLLAGDSLLHKLYPWLAESLRPHARSDVLEDSAKLAFLDAIAQNIRRDHDKLVIVSNYTQTLDVLGAWCKKRAYPYFQLDGKTPVLKRQQLVDIFNDKNSQEFV